MFDLAGTLFGNRRDQVAQGSTLTATGSTASADGVAGIVIDADVTPAEGIGDEDVDQTVIDLPTSPDVAEGDEVIVTLVGDGPLKTPIVLANPGSGDRMAAAVQDAHDLAASVEGIAQEAAAEVEQVRQDVADFRDDVATTYATKVEREDGDDAVKTWVTTNYTNSNDLATTYATKTLVSQTKDAIELAASQTYETQSDAAETYATKSALTVGLDGIRSEVAEDYQPKGDYATTASMNSAIQQSASSIESSVAATYETKSDAAATYATKTEVQQTAAGLDTRITTATNTANSAKSAVDSLQVGGTNLLHDTEDWANWACTAQVTVSDGVLTAVNTATVAFRKANGWFVPAKADILNEQIVVSFDAKKSASTALSTMCVQLFETDKPYKSVASGNITEGKRYYTVLNNAVWHDTAKINDSTWTRVYSDPIVLADVLTGSYPEYAYLAFYIGITNQIGSASYRNVMVERGTIATDWSPAPEDMATEADLQAEVTERQTLIRQFSGGVLAGYVGNSVTALMNAAGSFDVVQTTWSDGTPTVTDTLASFDSQEINIGPLRISTIQSGGGSPAGFVYADPVAIGSYIDSSSGEVMGGFWSESTEPSIVGTSLTLAPVELAAGVPSPGTPATIPMRQVLCALLHPCATYTPLVGTWNTGTANAWETAGFGVVVTETGNFTDYIDVTEKGVGEFVALVGCTVRVSACMTWVDSVAGRRSVGAFVNATRSGNNLSGGTEYSNSGLFYTGNNAKTAQLTPVVLHLAAGNRLNIGKYAPANAVQTNQAYKMNWVTIEVLAVD